MNRCFLESNFVGVKRHFVLVYSNQDDNARISKARRYYLTKVIVKTYNVIINRINFYEQATDSDIKSYKEIKRLTTGQGEDYSTGCLLNYDFIKNHYRLMAVDLSRQKELDADPKAIKQIEFVGQLKNIDGVNADEDDDDELNFVGWLTYKQPAAIFPEGTNVRKLHYHKFLTRHGATMSYHYVPIVLPIHHNAKLYLMASNLFSF